MKPIFRGIKSYFNRTYKYAITKQMDNQMKNKQIVKNTRRKSDNKLESQKYFLLTQTKKCGVNMKNMKQKDRQRKKNKTRTLLVFNGTNKEMWSQHEKHEIERQIDRQTEKENENVISI